MILINSKFNEYLIKEKYIIKNDWKIKLNSCRRSVQYFSSEIIANNKLLLNSYNIGVHRGICSKSYKVSKSKIIFIDLNNLEQILITEIFDIKVNCIILTNVILIQSKKKILIYDINTLNFIKAIKTSLNNMIYKLNEEYLITKVEDELIIFKIENNNLITHEIIKSSTKDIGDNLLFYDQDFFFKSLFPMKNNRFIYFEYYQNYLLQINEK